MSTTPPVFAQIGSILASAHSFLYAAERCGSPPQAPVEGVLRDGWLAVPQVVNYAFAVELAFKGIMLLAKGEAPKGHDLRQLFDQLPADAADAVRAGTGKDPEFDSKIAGVADAFEVWRYVHEKSGASVNVEFLAQLAKVSINTLHDTFKAKRSQAGTP